jgi:hypothetical protein
MMLKSIDCIRVYLMKQYKGIIELELWKILKN